MNSEFASKLADEVVVRFPDYHVSCVVLDSKHAHLVVETGKASFAIREARGKAIISPVYAELAKYIKHDERPAGWQSGSLSCELDTDAICDRIEVGISYLELFTDGLIKRKIAAKSDYQQAVATVTRLKQILPDLKVEQDICFYLHNDKLELSGEAHAGNVWLHVFCDTETAATIMKGLKNGK